MKAIRFHKAGSPLRVEKVPKPSISSGDVIVRMKSCGLCGGDVIHATEGMSGLDHPVPLILGHEPAGEVEEIATDVKSVTVGDRVVVYRFLPCGVCYYCRLGEESMCTAGRMLGYTVHGAFCEYLKVPASNLIKIPSNLTYDDACVLACSVSTAYRAVTKVGGLLANETVLVMGCGGVGLSALQIAKLCGARTIAVDILLPKLRNAREFGADHIARVGRKGCTEEVLNLTGNIGVDLAVDCVGTAGSIQASVECVKRGGRIVIVGNGSSSFKLETTPLLVKQMRLYGSQGSSMREMKRVVELAAEGKMRSTVARSFEMEEINDAIALLKDGKIEGRAVITVGQSSRDTGF